MLTPLVNALQSPRKAAVIRALCVVAVVLALGTSTWLGMRWQRGDHALADVATLNAQHAVDRQAIADLTVVAHQLQQHGIDAALAYDQARARLDAIDATLEDHLEQERQFSKDQRTALTVLLDRRPDLRQLRLGPDVLQHWNRSNQGPPDVPATGTAAEPAAISAPALPGFPAGNPRRLPGPDGQSRRRDPDRSRMPRPPRGAVADDGRVATHGVALVLPGHRAGRMGCHSLSYA